MTVRQLKSDWLHFLRREEVQQVHEAVLRVLSEVGVRIEWRPALEAYQGAGCQVDFEKRLVYIQEDLLNRALKSAPSSFELHAINQENNILVNTEDIYTIAGSSALSVLDLEGNHRPATLQDLSDFTRLIDGLDQADIMHAMIIPQDIPQIGFDRILFSTILKNTQKHYYSQGQGGQSVLDQIEMASIIQGSLEAVTSHPVFSFVVCFNSPLVHSAERLQEMMECARFNIPVWLEPTNMMGSTAPITIAGALVEHTANALAGLVLMQILHPGHPCILSISSGGFNMRSGTYVAASPEAVLLHCATAQMAHFYGLPFQGCSGLDSCLPDAQAGYERALQAIPMSLAGVNFIHLAFGMIGQLLTSSFEQAVIDNEIFKAVFQLARGIEVNDETLAVDQFKQVGPGGQFLTHPFTLHNYRRFQWQPQLTVRLPWEQWQRTYSGKDMRQRANTLARKILESHTPRPLSAGQETELDRMAKAFQQRAIATAGS
jgi:trimethylamine--corrinoid protein Co-methyltransferase